MADYAIHDTTLIAQANILRKKFGTSDRQDPADYAEKMNLMGPLEEKNVSGSIAAFSDGADDVPLKSCAVTISPTLDGVSSVDVVQTGKNLFNKNAVEQHTWIIVDSTETETRSAINYLTSDYIPVKANTRYFVSTKASNRAAYYDRNKNGISYFSFSGGGSFLCQYDGYIRLTIKDDTNLNTFVANEGNTAIQYEDFGATHTASLGRTIYGGTVDVVNGTGTETHGVQAFSGSETWTLSGTSFWYTTKSNPNVKAGQTITASNGVVIRYTTNGQIRCYPSENVGVVDTSTDMNALFHSNEWFGYELATPEDFTFTPVPIISRLGDNTMWSDGDLSVVYRSSGTQTIITPTLISKTVTENGTYTASDEGADGYDVVVVNVSGVPVSLNIHEGKLDIATGTITKDSTYCYTDSFDCPSGICRLDIGEIDNDSGLELIYISNGSHANAWSASARFREIDVTNYYSVAKQARLGFKKANLSKVLLMDFGNGKIYSSLNPTKLEEQQASLLMGGLVSSNSEEENTNSEQEESET